MAAQLPAGILLQTGGLGPETAAEVPDEIRFLRNEAWIFAPDHPRFVPPKARDAFDSQGERVSRFGSFWRPADLVFRDSACLLDSYKRCVSDQACDLAQQAAGVRVVGQYYWGPETLFPANLRGTYSKSHRIVHELFQQAGVRLEPSWCDYLAILRGVDAHIQEQQVALGTGADTPTSRIEGWLWCVVEMIFIYLKQKVDEELRHAAEREDTEEVAAGAAPELKTG
ncbi:unnamed protein product [Polarella glacialis]|uniref:Uncharacterized protein n=1 Tax=Polarella glacialis TaxID=89957 RepID=A0A813GQ67_POLGL|nr:unnamed protein product [Polarella glacialis]CAE8713326.1 unnamed protein product [Polarella glacialis]